MNINWQNQSSFWTIGFNQFWPKHDKAKESFNRNNDMVTVKKQEPKQKTTAVMLCKRYAIQT